MGTTSVDEYVGMRLKIKRSALGITQNELGDIIGVTFQQIQKYEKGSNRIGAGRLYELSKILNVPISYFYDGIEGKSIASMIQDVKESNESEFQNYEVPDKEVTTLLKFFIRIRERKIRESVTNLARSLSKSSAE